MTSVHLNYVSELQEGLSNWLSDKESNECTITVRGGLDWVEVRVTSGGALSSRVQHFTEEEKEEVLRIEEARRIEAEEEARQNEEIRAIFNEQKRRKGQDLPEYWRDVYETLIDQQGAYCVRQGNDLFIAFGGESFTFEEFEAIKNNRGPAMDRRKRKLSDLGYGGRAWYIIAGGRSFVSHNLWSMQIVPAEYRHIFQWAVNASVIREATDLEEANWFLGQDVELRAA